MDEILKQLTGLGPMGIVIAALLWDRTKLAARLDEVQEKRITEGRECLEALHASATAIEAQTRAIEALGRRT
jgi:hypothetical protein